MKDQMGVKPGPPRMAFRIFMPKNRRRAFESILAGKFRMSLRSISVWSSRYLLCWYWNENKDLRLIRRIIPNFPARIGYRKSCKPGLKKTHLSPS